MALSGEEVRGVGPLHDRFHREPLVHRSLPSAFWKLPLIVGMLKKSNKVDKELITTK